MLNVQPTFCETFNFRLYTEIKTKKQGGNLIFESVLEFGMKLKCLVGRECSDAANSTSKWRHFKVHKSGSLNRHYLIKGQPIEMKFVGINLTNKTF